MAEYNLYFLAGLVSGLGLGGLIAWSSFMVWLDNRDT